MKLRKTFLLSANYKSAFFLAILSALIASIIISLIVVARDVGKKYADYELAELSNALILRAQDVIKKNSQAGIDLGQMVAFDQVLAGLIKDRKDIAFMALLGSQRRVLAFAGQPGITVNDLFKETEATFTNHPTIRYQLRRTYVYSDQGSIGSIVVGIDLRKMDRAMLLVLMDCIIAAIVATVLTKEILRSVFPKDTLTRIFARTINLNSYKNQIQKSAEYFLYTATGSSYHEYDRLVAYIRLTIFLATFAEELIRPFLSVYIGEGLRSHWSETSAFIISSTLGAFSALYALSQLAGPILAQRISVQTSLRTALLSMLIGAGLFAFSNDWLIAIVGRALTGAGFGIVLIVGQTAILHSQFGCNVGVKEVGNVAAAMVAAGLCGPLIGGLLADHFGYRPILILAIVVIACACIVGFNIPKIPRMISSNQQLLQMKTRFVLASRSTAFMFAFAFPIKVVASAMLVYWIPLSIIREGESLMMAGRILTLYFLGYLVIQPIGKHLTLICIRPTYLVMTTVVVNSIASCLCLADGIFLLGIAMFLFGGAHSLSNTAQLDVYFNMANNLVRQEQRGPFLGMYRFAERIGGVTGPLLCVFIDIGSGGLEQAGIVLACIAVLSTLIVGFIVNFPLSRKKLLLIKSVC